MSDNTKNVPAMQPPSDDDGILVVGLRKVLGRSWKTSLAGLLGIGSTVVAAVATVPPDQLSVRALMPFLPGVLTAIGVLLSKDANVSGTKQQPDASGPMAPSPSTTSNPNLSPEARDAISRGATKA